MRINGQFLISLNNPELYQANWEKEDDSLVSWALFQAQSDFSFSIRHIHLYWVFEQTLKKIIIMLVLKSFFLTQKIYTKCVHKKDVYSRKRFARPRTFD